MSSLVNQYLRAHRDITIGELFREAWTWDKGREPSTAENHEIVIAATNYRTKKDYPPPSYVNRFLQEGGKPKAPARPYTLRPFWSQ